MRFPFLALICSICFFTACHPDPAPYIPADWQALSGFNATGKIPINEAIWDDQLHILTQTTLAKVTSATDAAHEMHGSEITARLPINADFFMSSEQDDQVLAFIPSKNPSNFNAKRGYINLVDLIPDISIKDSKLYPGTVADNGQGQILALFYTKHYHKVPVLFDVKMRKNSVWEVDTVTAKIINIPQIQTDRIYTKILSFGGQFLVSGDAENLQSVCVSIDAEGNAQTLAPSAIFNIIPIGGKLFGYGFGYLVSADGGKTWIKAGDDFLQSNPGLRDMDVMAGYTIIDGHVIMLGQSHIQEMIANPDGTIVASNLDQKGLTPGTFLTIKEWNGRVYIISASGIYSRSVKDFFTK
ncbi:MAG: hypothetical protein WCR52_12485 [Bacteroidota bacterium]|uniref:hypothetical protein n=1 Tax=Runella sp. TaxID=1960881 RepID=UPI00301993E6